MRAEHEVGDHQLRAAVEQLEQVLRPVLGLEGVLLLDPHPGELTALPSEFVAGPCVLLLALQQLSARGHPLFTRSDAAPRHRAVLDSSIEPRFRRRRAIRQAPARAAAPQLELIRLTLASV